MHAAVFASPEDALAGRTGSASSPGGREQPVGLIRQHGPAPDRIVEPLPDIRAGSRPRTCTQLILDAGIPRVVTVWKEPPTFVIDANGTGALTAAGVTVITLPELAEAARAANTHLLGDQGS